MVQPELWAQARQEITEQNSLRKSNIESIPPTVRDLCSERSRFNHRIARRLTRLDRVIPMRQYGDMRRRFNPSRLALEWWRWSKKQRLYHG